MAKFKVPDRSTPVRWRGSLDGLLPADHLARFVWTVLCSLDFTEMEAWYPSVQGGPGRSPYHPRLIAALWIYGMMAGFETATGIAEACRLREDFQWLAGGLCPSYQTLLNFLTRAQGRLSSFWIQVLQAMQNAGLVDLSLIAEDGTKLRANASPRSFRTIKTIRSVIEDLQKQLDARLKRVVERSDEETSRKAASELAALRARLGRAQQAEEELTHRIRRKQARQGDRRAVCQDGTSPPKRTIPRFDKSKFPHDADRDVLVCPAEQELRFVGEYLNESYRSSYRLYGRRDCTGCSLKAQCTDAKGRRVKIQTVQSPGDDAVDSPPTMASSRDAREGTDPDKDKKKESTASLTEPEAAWMLATSRKRWEPSFNADIAITGDGIIVSQFLTNDNTDYHHFAPALEFITENLGKPESWIGDGHYGTLANLVLADREAVILYAPRAGAPRDSGDRPGSQQPREEKSPAKKANKLKQFTRENYRQHPERDVLLCPADRELRFIGEYPNDKGTATYRLYGRRDCTECPIKTQCTRGRGRRVKIPGVPITTATPRTTSDGVSKGRGDASGLAIQPDEVFRLERELAARMEERGDELLTFRGHASEAVNAHLKQHGLERFHVRGMARCATVLTLACIAHNLRKWAATVAADTMQIAS